MSSNSKESLDSSWKVLVQATEKADREGIHKRKQRPALSYEQFVEQCRNTQTSSEAVAKDSKNCGKHENDTLQFEEPTVQDISVLGDWISDEEEEERTNSKGNDSSNLKCENGPRLNIHKKIGRNKLYSNKLERIVEEQDNSKDSSCIRKRKATLNNDNQSNNVDSDSSWESLSSSDSDKDFDNFFQTSRTDAAAQSRAKEKHMQSMPYTNLTECLLRHYYPYEPECTTNPQSRIRKRNGYDYEQEFEKPGQLTLEERLPLLQVIDALDDINKVLKVGKITPRMERILEYKQDHPFTEGYEEETLGWCPWLVYKVETLCKRISSKQWPYN